MSLTVLRDGSKVAIRQVRSTDAALLADGFALPSEDLVLERAS